MSEATAAARLDDLDVEDEWPAFAACRLMPARVFFLERAGDATTARNICVTCPVRAPCLAHALTNNERQGIWGGFTPKELDLLRRRLGIAQDLPDNLRRPGLAALTTGATE